MDPEAPSGGGGGDSSSAEPEDGDDGSRRASIQSGFDFLDEPIIGPGGVRRSSIAEFQERPPMTFRGARRSSNRSLKGGEAHRDSIGGPCQVLQCRTKSNVQRTLSQFGSGVKWSSDGQLLQKNPAFE